MLFNEFLKIGHRGAMAHAVENSKESIEKALDLNANMIEFDVRYSKDDVPLVFHDGKIDRLTNGVGQVCEMTFKELNSFSLKNGEKISSLEEILSLFSRKVLINLELKEDKISDNLIKVLSKFDVESILFSSFYHSNVLKIRDYFKEIKSAPLLVGNPLNPIKLVEETRADYLDLNYEFVDQDLIDKLHSKGAGVIVWKINEPDVMQKFINLKIDGIITDDPALFMGNSENKNRGIK